MLIVRIVLFGLGAWLVGATLLSAIRTFVLPRSARDALTRFCFVSMRYLFEPWIKRLATYRDRDRVLALYAPLSLLTLPVAWSLLVVIGYMAMYWALGIESWNAAFRLSGSSLFTLGFASVDDLPSTILVFTEAAIGLTLVALLIAYLPTIYGGFSRREAGVSMLEVRAGSPPSAVELWQRFHRLQRLHLLNDLWAYWEQWFVEVEETHTSLAALSFFRSPQPGRNWVIAAGAVLDAATLRPICASAPASWRCAI